MSDDLNNVADRPIDSTPAKLRGRLFWKYAALIVGVVCTALLSNGLIEIWVSYRDHRASLVRLQHEQANAAATRIGQFIKDIEGSLRWMTQLPWSTTTSEEQRFDAIRLLRQVPAITELSLIDGSGRERLRVSRLTMNAIASGIDRSSEPAFVETRSGTTYFGSVHFRRQSVPHLTLAISAGGHDPGIVVAEVNLTFILDVISQIKIGENGKVYVLDSAGSLVAHQDIDLVLRDIDFSGLSQFQAARRGDIEPGSVESVATDIVGRKVLTTQAAIEPLGWLVFVELPLSEAYAPIYASLTATGLVLLAGLALAVFVSFVLARKMVMPIRALQAGSTQIGLGALDHRISIKTGDELEALGDQFNSMAAQLQRSHASLERKVVERTHQLQLANLAKSRFIAAASHDLRQPLHALNLFIAQLIAEPDTVERTRIAGRVDAAMTAMNELFNALLDISKLDAGVLVPNIANIPIDHILNRIGATFSGSAQEKGLRLRIVRSRAWVRSDPILLERILLNLVSNAVRYTTRGRIVVGCRRRGTLLQIEVWDSGIGIAEDKQQYIFGEFHQITASDHKRSPGLGLGLSIVDRLCQLLDHPIEVVSSLGKGSCFSIMVPIVDAQLQATGASESSSILIHPAEDKLVVVIEDDALVRDAMDGLLRSWGCRVVTVSSEDDASKILAQDRARPDLVISDLCLANGKTGIEAIERLQAELGQGIPAFLITGDTAPEQMVAAKESGYRLLYKPIQPMVLRSMVLQYLTDSGLSHDQASGNVAVMITD